MTVCVSGNPIIANKTPDPKVNGLFSLNMCTDIFIFKMEKKTV